MISEARVGTVLVAAGVAISIAVYVVTGNSDKDTSYGTRSNSSEGRAEMVFSPTGKYMAGDPSMPLVLHSFQVTPDYISVVYTLVGGPKDMLQSFSPTIVDDKGQTYRTLSNAILGSADGVLAGLLVVETHIPGGSVLTIDANSAEMEGGSTQSGHWSIPFLQTADPNGAIAFIEGGRLSPEEGADANGARVGVAGPPGSSPAEVLVHRDGKTTSLFGTLDQKGEARAISRQEFQAMLGASGYPKPPLFPSTAPASN